MNFYLSVVLICIFLKPVKIGYCRSQRSIKAKKSQIINKCIYQLNLIHFYFCPLRIVDVNMNRSPQANTVFPDVFNDTYSKTRYMWTYIYKIYIYHTTACNITKIKTLIKNPENRNWEHLKPLRKKITSSAPLTDNVLQQSKRHLSMLSIRKSHIWSHLPNFHHF